MKKYLLFIVFTFLFLNCSENVVGPIEDIPGSSNYEWFLDTIDVEMGHSINRLYASSANDVWACGDGEVWHYINSKWSKDNSIPGWGYGALGGSDNANVWMVANGNYNGVDIFKYNGSNWNKFGHYEYEKLESYLWLNDVWGDSPNNIYGVGAIENKTFTKNIGIVMKYDGVKWNILDTPEINMNFYGIRRDIKGNGKYYIYGEQIVRDTTTNPITITDFVYKIFEFDGTNIREIFSNTSLYIYPTIIGGQIYFIGENTIQKYQNGSFITLKDFTGSEYNIGSGQGRNSKDIIFWCVKGNDYWGPKYLVHYNGNELKEIFSTEGDIHGLQIVDNGIFVIIKTPDWKWIIAQGVIKN